MLFKMVDTDNSGHLSLDEFKVLHEIIVKDEQARAANIKDLDATVTRNRETIKRLRKVVLAAFLFCCAFLGIIGGMTVGVVKGFKDTEAKAATSILYTSNGTKIVTTNPVLADNYGNVMETAPAIVALPMRAAPVLPMSQLNSLTRLTMSFTDLDTGSPTLLQSLKVSIYISKPDPHPSPLTLTRSLTPVLPPVLTLTLVLTLPQGDREHPLGRKRQ